MGGFAEATLTVLDGVNVTGGARYDNHSTFGDKWSPHIYGVWNINDTLTLKGGVSGTARQLTCDVEPVG